MNRKVLITLTLSLLFLTGCTPKKTSNLPSPTPAPAIIELPVDKRPYISLIPRDDGHELTLLVKNIPNNIISIDYELLYTAVDKDTSMEIEKGDGDTISINSASFERKVLLGTASCTNGCKYKYDEGVTGGTISLTLLTKDNNAASFETPFVLKNSTQIKKDGSLSLKTENFTIKAKPAKEEFFILLKNYQPKFSVFSSGSGKGTVTSISPENISKADTTTITGDYLIP